MTVHVHLPSSVLSVKDKVQRSLGRKFSSSHSHHFLHHSNSHHQEDNDLFLDVQQVPASETVDSAEAAPKLALQEGQDLLQYIKAVHPAFCLSGRSRSSESTTSSSTSS